MDTQTEMLTHKGSVLFIIRRVSMTAMTALSRQESGGNRVTGNWGIVHSMSKQE